MRRTRRKLTIEWDLDPIPGWNHDPEDFPKYLRKFLESNIPHYNPEVTLVPEEVPMFTDELFPPPTKLLQSILSRWT